MAHIVHLCLGMKGNYLLDISKKKGKKEEIASCVVKSYVHSQYAHKCTVINPPVI